MNLYLHKLLGVFIVQFIMVFSISAMDQKHTFTKADFSGAIVNGKIDPTTLLNIKTQLKDWQNNHHKTTVLPELKKVNGDVITQQIIEEWIDEAWVVLSKMINTYIGSALTETVIEWWDNGTLERSLKWTLTYENELIKEWIVQVDDEGDGTYVNFSKDIYTYQSGNLTTMLTKTWESESWLDFTKMTYTYNSGNIETILIENWENVSWNKTFLTTYTYENGKIKTELTEFWDGSWQNSYKLTNTYDGNGNKIEAKNQMWDGMSWIDNYTFTWFYDANGDVIEYISDMSMMGFTMKDRVLYSYAAGKVTTEENQTWNMGTNDWDNISKVFLTYSGDNLIERLAKMWDYSGYNINYERITYTYGSIAVDDDFNHSVIPEKFSLFNFPNPFNPQTTIQFELQRALTVSINIFDSNGRLVKSLSQNEYRTAGLHSVVWDGTDMNNRPISSGVYFYQIQTDSYTQTENCILLK